MGNEQSISRVRWQGDIVPVGQFEQGFRAHCSLKVDVQFNFRHLSDEFKNTEYYPSSVG